MKEYAMSASDLAKQYEALTDEQLEEIRVADLIPQAQAAYEVEVRRRATPEYRERQHQMQEQIDSEAAHLAQGKRRMPRWAMLLVAVVGIAIWGYLEFRPVSIATLSNTRKAVKYCDTYVKAVGTVSYRL